MILCLNEGALQHLFRSANQFSRTIIPTLVKVWNILPVGTVSEVEIEEFTTKKTAPFCYVYISYFCLFIYLLFFSLF